jgi:hypothetical protein
MQAREVGQICTQNIKKWIRLFYYCNPTFFATKATTLSSECPLQEGPKNVSRRQNQTSASYVHNLFVFFGSPYIRICFSSFPSSSQVSWMLGASILCGAVLFLLAKFVRKAKLKTKNSKKKWFCRFSVGRSEREKNVKSAIFVYLVFSE